MDAIAAVLSLFLTASASAAPSIEEESSRREIEARVLVGEESQERSRLHDDIDDDVVTDGFASDVHEDCRNVTVRYRRSDGVTVIRKVNRCR